MAPALNAGKCIRAFGLFFLFAGEMWRESYQAINKAYQCKAISLTFGIYCFKTVPKLILKNLRRENELLKHQLKKYVGAVQALRTNMQSRSPDTAEGKTINFKYLKLLDVITTSYAADFKDGAY